IRTQGLALFASGSVRGPHDVGGLRVVTTVVDPQVLAPARLQRGRANPRRPRTLWSRGLTTIPSPPRSVRSVHHAHPACSRSRSVVSTTVYAIGRRRVRGGQVAPPRLGDGTTLSATFC